MLSASFFGSGRHVGDWVWRSMVTTPMHNGKLSGKVARDCLTPEVPVTESVEATVAELPGWSFLRAPTPITIQNTLKVKRNVPCQERRSTWLGGRPRARLLTATMTWAHHLLNSATEPYFFL